MTATLAPLADVAVLRNLQKRFGERTVLRNINLHLRRGEFVVLLGASGSGKTTLLRILSSLERASSGSLEVAQNRAVVFQEPRLMPFRSVHANVAFGLTKAERRHVDVHAALAEVGLEQHQYAWPKHLSGGEAQRVALARALVRAPDLLLLDEPFAALDALTRLRMQNLVLRLWVEHRPGVLFITHDVEEAIALADRVLVLKQGELAVDLTLPPRRPRDRSSALFRETRALLLDHLGVAGSSDAASAVHASAAA
ncbi:ABC transporter ATP-binding protein [Burkholderia multivorans]|uniref:ABC transporter ATP-binding protein n=1 Tax=Burkholderia multivorans TaxID=87883 RepID=UPI0021BE5E3B|nr:ABC transporter ATP-binding protein [Burkholderia multivorans]MDR8761961.1 Aliphatic sulfonates import ATP-binding protein SsuB [Burkholderia multivorans]MDR8766237.1 Aliphatic sulfonates import ATP-binding protein SsuB [Burkholderia multivorans]MDR8769974.1 Aliphatic sulfonates import ATP-binding protein SsuB [Burkholderia multivorans]MDR8792069.1 Aliphatic sulfonates import ATP-binding protein SsuB [Burkholderia multivorans]MDR8794530.1 Aliphatic sulfonates import ATP-binding protein SsuB